MIYFQQIEVAFDQHKIASSIAKYRCLMLALPQEVVTPHRCFLQTITAATPDPYECLKTRLLQTYAPTDSVLLSQPAGKLFLALYLQRLPATMRERVAGKHFTDLQQLAEYADTLWEAQARAAAYHRRCPP